MYSSPLKKQALPWNLLPSGQTSIESFIAEDSIPTAAYPFWITLIHAVSKSVIPNVLVSF
jgi:hypothetical protein